LVLAEIYGNLHARQEWQFFARSQSRTPYHRAHDRRSLLEARSRIRLNEVIVSNAAGQIVSVSRRSGFPLRGANTQASSSIARAKKTRNDSFQNRPSARRGDRISDAPPQLKKCAGILGPQRGTITTTSKKRWKLGFPEIVVQGMLSVCMIAEMMTQRFGLGFLYGGKMDLRLVNVVWGKRRHRPKGLIVETRPEGKRTRRGRGLGATNRCTKTIVGSASARFSDESNSRHPPWRLPSSNYAIFYVNNL